MCSLNQKPKLSLDVISNIIKEKAFYTEYQPFISVIDNQIMGYEALARFEINNIKFPPDVVFEYAHIDIKLFWELEYAVKIAQFASRPKNSKLFVNFDPHVLTVKEKINQFFDLFKINNDFTLELIENSHHCINLDAMLALFRKHNIALACDDFFKENSMVSFGILEGCHYIKLDKDILFNIKKNKNFYYLIDGIVKYANLSQKVVILEGIESMEDFKIAKQLGVDYVQGFLFRDKFIERRNTVKI